MTAVRWPQVVVLLPGAERHVFNGVDGACEFIQPNGERCPEDHRNPPAPARVNPKPRREVEEPSR